MNIELKNSIEILAKSYRAAVNASVDNEESTELATAAAQALVDLDKAVKDYNDALRNETYDALVAAEKPFLAAIQQGYFKGLASYKPVFERLPDKTVGKKLDDVKTDYDGIEYISLKKLDGMNTSGTWAHEASWSASLLSLRLPLACARAQATNLDWVNFKKAFGLSPDTVTVYADYMPENASNDAKMHNLCIKLACADLDDDTNGISRNKATELLQFVVNAIIFNPNDKGANTYRVHKSDTTWFVSALANYQSKTHSTKFAKPETMYSLIFDVLRRVVCNVPYPVAVK